MRIPLHLVLSGIGCGKMNFRKSRRWIGINLPQSPPHNPSRDPRPASPHLYLYSTRQHGPDGREGQRPTPRTRIRHI